MRLCVFLGLDGCFLVVCVFIVYFWWVVLWCFFCFWCLVWCYWCLVIVWWWDISLWCYVVFVLKLVWCVIFFCCLVDWWWWFGWFCVRCFGCGYSVLVCVVRCGWSGFVGLVWLWCGWLDCCWKIFWIWICVIIGGGFCWWNNCGVVIVVGRLGNYYFGLSVVVRWFWIYMWFWWYSCFVIFYVGYSCVVWLCVFWCGLGDSGLVFVVLLLVLWFYVGLDWIVVCWNRFVLSWLC